MQNIVYLRVRRHDKANQKLLIRGSMDARKRERAEGRSEGQNSQAAAASWV